MRDIARLTGRGGIAMTVATTACGLQFYEGAKMSEFEGRDGRRHGPFAGPARKTQGWPGAPNRPHVPDSLLRPGQLWTVQTHSRFTEVRA